MKIELSEKDVMRLIDQEMFTEKLSDKIIRTKKDSSWDELDALMVKAVKDSAKIMITDMMEHYFLEENMMEHIKDTMAKITKKEILSMLNGKITVDW